MAGMGNDVVVELRLIGGRAFAAQVGQVDTAMGRLETQADRTAKASGRLQSGLDRAAGSFRKVAGRAGAAAAATGGLFALKGGLAFNAQIESATTTFAHFFHSTDRAKDLVQSLWDLAAKTPFEFPQLLQA